MGVRARQACGATYGNERERMKGGWRLAIAVWTAALALGAGPLAAQSTPPATSDTPATDAVGPQDLQNFSLSGRVTRPADQQPATRAETKAPTQTATQAAEPSAPTRRRTQAAKPAPSPAATSATTAPVPKAAPPPAEPSVAQAGLSVAAAAPVITLPPKPEPASAPVAIAPEHHVLLWPWILAALIAAGAGAFFLLRNRARPAYAGGPELDLFTPPEPAVPAQPGPRAIQPAPASQAPQPAPASQAPAPAPKPAAKPAGAVVSTGLRPWVEVAMQPVRCIVDDAKVTIEFDLELFNSGSAAAKAILVEALIFNAGPTQDQEIGAFFAQAADEGDRIETIPPLQRISLRTQVSAPRDNIQLLDAGGRQFFVPLIAFNAIYRWSGHDGQTSVSYLLGRETNGEKMSPFRTDLGPRQFRNLGARVLPTGVRR